MRAFRAITCVQRQASEASEQARCQRAPKRVHADAESVRARKKAALSPLSPHAYLEGLLDIDGLLSRRLKVGDFVLGVAPLLRSLRRYCAVVQVNLQADTVIERKI